MAMRDGGLAHGLSFRHVEVGQDAPGIFQKPLTDLGDGQPARRAVEYLRAKAVFKGSIAGSGALDPQTRERIALAVAEQNACQYCVSAHTAIGRKAGLANDEMLANRQGRSSDAKADAALIFTRALVTHTGQVSKAEVDAVRAAGHSDGEIIEIITHVAMNIFTNLLGKSTQVEIDFPKIDLSPTA